jgi:hypothetical protein
MEPDPDPTLDLIPLFSDFKYAKKSFVIFFSFNLSTGTLSSVLKFYFLQKVLCLNFILQALFQSAQHIYEKREGSGAGSGSGASSGSVPLTNGSGSGKPKNMRVLRIRNRLNTVSYLSGVMPTLEISCRFSSVL